MFCKKDYIWVGGKHSVITLINSNKYKVLEIFLKNKENIKNIPQKYQIITQTKNNNFFEKLFSKNKINHQGYAVKIVLKNKYLQDLKQDIKNIHAAVILDNIYDNRNIGSILRSAAAFNFNTLIIEEKKFNFDEQLMHKTSSGGINFVNIYRVKNIKHAINLLKENQFYIYAVSGNGKDNIRDIKFEKKIGLIFGSEDKGIRKTVLESADISVNIPINKRMESLNLSNAAAITFYEIKKTRWLLSGFF